jgi:hypothetical protein
LTTDIPTGGLTFSVRDAFIDTGTVFTGFGGLIIGAGRKLGIREGTNLTRSLQNNGVLAPGLEFGSITVQSFRQDPGASLQIQISGTTVDTQFDRLVVTDGALLGGALDVSIFGSFAPVAGNTFTVLTAGFLVDTFDDVNLPQLTAGLVWGITQTSTAFTLTVNTGDYNRDGVVNAADYVVWRKTQNTSVPAYSGADGNGDGTINQGDFTIWRANFGNTRGGSSGGSGSQAGHAVPEPSSAITLIVGGLLRLRRRQSGIVRAI